MGNRVQLLIAVAAQVPPRQTIMQVMYS